MAMADMAAGAMGAVMAAGMVAEVTDPSTTLSRKSADAAVQARVNDEGDCMAELNSLVGRVYRTHWVFRVFGVLFAAAGTGLFIFIFGMVVLGLREPKIKELLPVLVILVASNFTAFMFLKPKVTIYADRIELRGAFKTQQIPLSAIRGRRKIVVANSEGSSHYRRLVSKEPAIPSLDLESSFGFDAEFKQWYLGLPDLDVLEPEPKVKGRSKK